MRIISGSHKGRKIHPPNNLPVRPTTDMAKESLFNILSNRYFFENKSVLDLFSGTGNISFEFCSRGIKDVTSVDNNIKCVSYISEQAKEFGFDISTFQSDCIEYVRGCNRKFNFIFADPPYQYEDYFKLKELILKKNMIEKDGVLVFEHDKSISFTEKNIEVRKYGHIHFSIFYF